jgi:NAD(P)-dependent dehydrogenase (short-subunit alcohol dehydrogenase family)
VAKAAITSRLDVKHQKRRLRDRAHPHLIMPTYVVTGASGGIGLGIVTALAARGDKVFATVRKRESTATGQDNISKVQGDVTVIEGIDVCSDDVGAKLIAALSGVTIDAIVHNAGGLANRDGPDAPKGMASFADGGGGPGAAKLDSLKSVTTERMLAAFQVNTLGPLRVQQALTDQMAKPGGKVLIISTGMGSIGDNGSGGLYAYRSSKAAVNMVMKNMSLDLKALEISVMSINPGMVVTDFGPGAEALASFGAMPVEDSVAQLLQIFDMCSMEHTGKFWSVKKGAAPMEYAGGF